MDLWITPTLIGRHVRLEPLCMNHADALRAAAADGALWTVRYTSVPGPEAGEVETYIDTARDAGHALPFAVLDASDALVGTARFYDIDPSVPRVKLGYTWYAQRVQRTALNTEAKLLLIEHAFADGHCPSWRQARRCAARTDAPSRRQLARHGGVFDSFRRVAVIA